MPEKLSDEVRALLEEHLRLRSDIDRLLGENQRLREEKDKQQAKPDEKQQQREEPKQEEQQEPKRPVKERARFWAREHPIAVALSLAGLVVLLIGGYFFWRYLHSYVSTDDAEVDGHTNQIGSRIAGTVVGVYTDNNRSVQQGQVLVDLDPRDYQAVLAQARANLAQAQANLQAQTPNVPITETAQSTAVATSQLEVTNAEAALVAARQGYESAVAELRQAEANAANASAEETRYRNLVAKEEVSRELYDQRATNARAQQALVASRRAAADAANKAVDQRQAALDQARQRAKEAQSNEPRQVAVQHATVATRRANVQAAAAQVQQATLNLSYCKIVAPVSGIIGDKTVEVGQQVAPGQELFAITPINDLWVTANFKETQIRDIRPGQSVRIHVDALDQDFEGYVENMPGATGAKYSLLPPENATGNYVKVVQRLPVRIRFKPNQSGAERLRPGMSVEPKVWLK